LLNQKEINKLSDNKELIIICSKNSGIDENINNFIKTKNVSIGNYIVNSGDLAAIILINSITRNNDKLIKNIT